MAKYKYTALSYEGAKVSGVIEGYNELDAAKRIKESCEVILNLQAADDKRPGFLNMEFGGNRLNSKAFTVMCSQFAIILQAGIPIARAVRLIAEKTTDKPLRRILDLVAEDVESGRTLSSAFEEHGAKLLPDTFIEVLRAGEESGDMSKAFETMHDHFDKQTKVKAKVRGAMAYPLFVLVIAVVVVVVMMIKVIPTFVSVFEEGGAELPGMTRALIGVSDFFRNNILIIVGVIAAIVLALKLYGNTEQGRLNLAKLTLRLPVLGNIAMLRGASQFSNTMATLMGAGLQMAKSVSITSRTLDNYYLATENGKLSGELEAGRTLSASMRDQAVMPDILVDMVGVGEDTGELTETLDTIARFYDQELDEAIASALAKLEPAMLIAIALIAGFVVISMYVTMFNMYDTM